MNRKAALTGALRTAQLAGAALDVLALEPPDEHEDLIGPPNVVITPHAGFCSEQSPADLRSVRHCAGRSRGTP
ncbi:NAD(P)-dependent oxidoreductase [Nonomuraea sp. NPDC049141]|uniref:NAD(P)-dependent oxidoreductase n=1 Tax=Nonomuraea sp. NPDC049141 TaxID=3155500 RepID=UPI0033CB2E5A